jgi:hypothetical protein
MPLLDVSVFVSLAGLNLSPFHAVMPHQRFIALLEIGQFGEIIKARQKKSWVETGSGSLPSE